MFWDYYMSVALYKVGKVHFRLIGTNGFNIKAKNERFADAGSRCRQNVIQIWKFHVVI